MNDFHWDNCIILLARHIEDLTAMNDFHWTTVQYSVFGMEYERSLSFEYLHPPLHSFSHTIQIPSLSFHLLPSSSLTTQYSLATLLPAAEMTINTEEDLISELPDSLVHYIFYFLDMLYVVRTSILSKRWRYVWTSAPFLNFNQNEFEKYTDHTDSLETLAIYNDFNDFVERVLLLRNGSANIHTFRLSSYENSFKRGIDTWIRFAVLRSVEDLDIHTNSEYKKLKLPYCLFTSKSIRKLKLNMSWKLELSPSGSVGLPLLKSMNLAWLSFVGGKGISSLISRCPVLETLIIYHCNLTQTNNLTISALQLKTLEINMVYGDEYHPEYCKITVFAPVLTSFRCSGWIMNEYTFENNSSLVSAYIDIDYCYNELSRSLPLWGEERVLAEKETKNTHLQNVIKCFEGLANLKFLVLSPHNWLLEYFAEVPLDVWNQLTPFHDLSFLELKLSLSENYSSALKYLLEKCPNVETIILELYVAKPKKGMQREVVILPLHHLKHVEIRNVLEGKDELELIKCFLRNAITLKKMIVIMSGNQSFSRKKIFIDQVVTFSKGFSVELSI